MLTYGGFKVNDVKKFISFDKTLTFVRYFRSEQMQMLAIVKVFFLP